MRYPLLASLADHGQGWSESLRTTDAVFEHFFDTCHAAKEKCLLYRYGDRVEDIRERFDIVMTRVTNEPLIIVSRDSRLPVVVSVSLLKQLFFIALYQPVSLFPTVALVVDLLYREMDLSLLNGGTQDLYGICGLREKLPIDLDDSSKAIGCSDWRGYVSGLASCLIRHGPDTDDPGFRSAISPWPIWRKSLTRWQGSLTLVTSCVLSPRPQGKPKFVTDRDDSSSCRW